MKMIYVLKIILFIIFHNTFIVYKLILDLAYLALGGSSDKNKGIDKEKLTQVIKNDFELTIDIEVYILKKFIYFISIKLK
jgi:hypothetical protein